MDAAGQRADATEYPETDATGEHESRVLGRFVRAVSERGNARLRLAAGRHGDGLIPTEAERLETERARAEAERERAEAAERQALTERIARGTLAVQSQNERDARGEAEAALARALVELEQLRHRR